MTMKSDGETSDIRNNASKYQKFMVVLLLSCLLCIKPFTDGLAYLEKVPPSFECE